MKVLKPGSLFGQLMLAQFGILLVFGIVLPVMLTRLFQNIADGYATQRLFSDIAQIEGSLTPTPAGLRQAAPPVLSGAYSKSGGNKSYSVLARDGSVIAEGPRSFTSPRNAKTLRNDRFYRVGAFDILAHPVAIKGQEAVILVEQNRTDPEIIYDDVISNFLGRILWIIPVSMVLIFMVGALVSYQALKKVRELAETADRIAPHRLDVRLDEQNAPSELAPLLRAANRALDRLEIGFREQNDFVASVSHELRTPLAVVALRANAIEDPDIRASILDGVTRTSHVVGQLMELASVENSAPGFEPMNLAAIASETIVQHAPLAFRQGKTIELVESEYAGPVVYGNPGLCRIVLSNLIDNAVRHTPKGTAIRVQIGPGAEISVLDDGPGIQKKDAGMVRKKYWRADRTRSDGAGLGLAISDRIMALHGGGLDLVNPGEGGAHFCMRFHQAGADPASEPA